MAASGATAFPMAHVTSSTFSPVVFFGTFFSSPLFISNLSDDFERSFLPFPCLILGGPTGACFFFQSGLLVLEIHELGRRTDGFVLLCTSFSE